MIKRLWREAGRGAATDPERHSPLSSPDRIGSFANAIAGCAYMLRRQKNMPIIAAATALVVALAVALGVDAIEMALLTLVIAGVWTTEFVNTAIEACVNLSMPVRHPMARTAKDVGAGASLLAVIAAVIVGGLVMGPRLAAAAARLSGATG